MSFRRLSSISNLRMFATVLLLGFCIPTAGLCQLNGAPNFSLSTSVIVQGGCYSLRVSNWPAATLNLGFTTAWTGQQYIYGFPSLDYTGSALLCSTLATQTGTYTYNSVSNTNYYQWWSVNASVAVNPTSPSQQPTSLMFYPPSGYAGLDCYALIVGNGSNMTVDFNYAIGSVYQPYWSATMDGAGQWRYCLNQHDQIGDYVFYQMKSRLLPAWVTISPPVTYRLRPPQPLWFVTSPDGIVQGNWYQMSVGNGAAVALDVQYTLNDGPVQTIIGWPTLIPGDGNYGYNGSSMGYVNVWTGSSTTLGKYTFIAIKNTQNTDWVPVVASVAVCPNSAPLISSIVPNKVPQGGSAEVTITGSNLCSISLQPVSANGLSFSNIKWNAPFVSVTATASASNSLPIGPVQIRLTTPAGSVTAQCSVTAPTALTKEYIYLGDRVITTVSP